MKIKQLSIFLENKPGALSRPVKLLAKAKFNLLTLSLADTQQYGILRLIIRDWEKAQQFLQKEGFVVKVTDIIAVQVADAPGGLAKILDVLEPAGINLEYMYGFPLRESGKALLAMRFDDPDRAIAALEKKGIHPVKSADVFKRLES
jgi:hypothetical protein